MSHADWRAAVGQWVVQDVLGGQSIFSISGRRAMAAMHTQKPDLAPWLP
jgi:hypothetical protein